MSYYNSATATAIKREWLFGPIEPLRMPGQVVAITPQHEVCAICTGKLFVTSVHGVRLCRGCAKTATQRVRVAREVAEGRDHAARRVALQARIGWPPKL